jgi:hypothetical protein
MRWTEHVACMVENDNHIKNLLSKLERKHIERNGLMDAILSLYIAASDLVVFMNWSRRWQKWKLCFE